MKSSDFLKMLVTAHNVPNRYSNKYPRNLGYFDGSKYSFDCWNLIKVVLSGWKPTGIKGDYIKPSQLITGDVDGKTLLSRCTKRSKDFSKISIPGTYLYLASDPHSGIYVGDTVINGKTYNVIECTNNSWGNGVLYTYVDSDGTRRQYKGSKSTKLKWSEYGLLTPYVEYDVQPIKEEPKPVQDVYYVKKGDTLSGIAKKNGMSLAKLVSYNPQIKDINKINIGQKIYLGSNTSEEYYTVKKGDTLGGIARQFNISLNKLLGLNPDIKNPNLIHIGDKIRIK
jgi:LysM repeat protein